MVGGVKGPTGPTGYKAPEATPGNKGRVDINAALARLNVNQLPQPGFPTAAKPPLKIESVSVPNVDGGAKISVQTDSFGGFTIEQSALPPVLAENPNGAEILAQKIENGGKLLNQIMDQDSAVAMPPLRESDASDMAWFLFAKAAPKNNSNFVKGAITIPDPGGAVLKALDRVIDSNGQLTAYQRSSSHLSGYQKSADNNSATQRGINFRNKTPETALPNGMRTVLYGAMPEGTLGLPEGRLYIKMEERGAAVSTLTAGQFDSSGPQGKPPSVADFRESAQHATDFLKAHNDMGVPPRREDVPKPVLNQYKAILQQFSGPKNAPYAQVLAKNGAIKVTKPMFGAETVKSEGGIQAMLQNVAVLQKMLPPSDPRMGLLNTFVENVMQQYDHAHVRVGNEVVFSRAELQ